MVNGGNLLKRLSDQAAYYDAIAKWASTTPQEEWKDYRRNNPNPSPPYGTPPYLYIKLGPSMNGQQFDYALKALYQRRSKFPDQAKLFFRPFPPHITEDEITFIGSDPSMSVFRLAEKAVNVLVALEEEVGFPNNLSPKQLASLVDTPDGIEATTFDLNTRLAAAWAAQEKEETAKAEAGRETDPLQRRLNEVEGRLWKLVELGRKANLNFAPEFLERFLTKKGGVRRLSRAEYESLAPLVQAEEVNRRRFETMFLGDTEDSSAEPGGKAEVMRQKRLVIGLKDGDQTKDGELTDKWARDITGSSLAKSFVSAALPFSGQHVSDAPSPDFFFAIGESKLISVGKFFARREKDLIVVQGEVRHLWSDTYGFEKGKPSNDDGAFLQQHGRGKIFDLRSDWRQTFKGKLPMFDDPKENWVVTDPKWGPIRRLDKRDGD